MEECLTKKLNLLSIYNMIKSGAKIIDIGGESTRPGSKDINHKIEFKRIRVF